MKPEDGEQPDDELRELRFLKNQYGRRGDTVVVRYQGGLFLPLPGINGLDKLAREAKAEEVFLELLSRFAREGRNAGEKANSPNYAPTCFAREAEAKKLHLKREDLEGAMRRLFTIKKIYVENYGRPSRPYTRLAVK